MQNLFDAIAGLQVEADNVRQSAAGLLAASPLAERQFRQAVLAQRRVGHPRKLTAGPIAVDVTITAEQLTEALRTALKEELPQAPRQIRLAPSAGVAIVATGQAAEYGFTGDDRPGWRHCEHGDITMSQAAAERDLRQRLLVWIMRVPLVGGQSVGQLARQEPRIKDALRRQLDRITASEFALEPTGICVLTCAVSAEQLSVFLRSSLAEAGLTMDGDLKPAVAFESTMTVQGFSVAPPRRVDLPRRSNDGSRPSWAGHMLTKAAFATAPEMNEPELRRSLAVQAARVEAQRQLWIDLENLPLPGGQTLGQHIEHRSGREQLTAAIDAAILTVSSPIMDEKGTARITLGLPLQAVWQIVGQ